MKKQRNHNSSGSSWGSPSGESVNLRRFLQSIMKNQQEQMEILHQRLLMVLREQRPGNISEINKLQPIVFSTKKLLDAEQWLIEVVNLMRVLRIQMRTW